MAVCFRETRETINLLRRVVDKLDESNGYISAEDLWDGVQCVPANVWSPDLTVARHGVRQMEGVSDVLQSFMSTLVSTYKTHTSTTRRRARIPQLTVNSLPNEIIHHIVKDALDCRKPISLIRYSHVSSKILNVILDSPSLWASIPLTLDVPTWLIQTIIARSAALKLTVDIHIHGIKSFSSRETRRLSSNSFLSRLSAMIAHHQRWEELSLSVDNEPEKLILQNFPSVNLTSVRVLQVSYQQMDTDFFQKWEIPPLEKLDWGNACRSPPSSMATQTLRVCALQLRKSNSNVLSTASFLRAATGLRSLKLELKASIDSGPTELPEIRLPCLEHLDIDYSLKYDPTTILLKSIHCPGLKHLTFRACTHAEYSTLTENMRMRYPILTSFTLVIEESYPREEFFFNDIMCQLPNTIKDLKIRPIYDGAARLCASRRDDIVPQNFYMSFSTLTNLDMEGCSIQEESFYEKVSEILRNFGVSLDHFRPGWRKRKNRNEEEQEKKDAVVTLQYAGVLAGFALSS